MPPWPESSCLQLLYPQYARFMKKIFVLFILSILTGLSATQAQNTITGSVLDARSGEPLAFVNLLLDDGPEGSATDIDGKFSIVVNRPVKAISLSYVGYQAARIPVDKTQGLLLKMSRRNIELAEVIIVPGENPAHRIIRNVIASRGINDYEKLDAFKYKAYEKMVFAINADSIMLADTALLDTSALKLRKFVEKRDFFMIENVFERLFKAPNRSVEKVAATRMSGFRDPVFVFLLSQLQTSTFYKEEFRIGDRTYINPISSGSLNRYFYQIEDTVITRTDSTFVISFRPWKGTNFDGLKGVISITSDGWAIRNVIAEPAVTEKTMSVKIQQLYYKPDSIHWFPKQLNTDIVFRNMEVQAGKGANNRFHMIARGRTYISEIQINPEIKGSELAMLGTDVDPKATNQSTDFWKQHRIDSLSARELETFRFIDSVGRKANFDRLGRIMDAAMSGRIPVGLVDLDFNRLFRYSKYEGWYAGLGLITNDRISRRFNLNGFWGYGFHDKAAKYGGGFEVVVDRIHEIALGYQYNFDIRENGSTEFPFARKSMIDETFFREILTSRYDRYEQNEVRLKFRAMRHFLFGISAGTTINRSGFDYQFTPLKDMAGPAFRFTELKAGFRYAFRERFVRTVRNKISLGSDYPIVTFNYTHGFDDVLNGGFNYDKLDINLVASKYFRFTGRSTLRVQAGLVEGDVPLAVLYNAPAAYAGFSVQSDGSFSTMRMNEFYSDRYVALFFSHDFESLLFKAGWFQPRPELLFNALWGDMTKPMLHQGVVFDVPRLGYYEAGININNLLNLQFYSLGIGGAWRFGPYSLPALSDNLALMLTFKWGF